MNRVIVHVHRLVLDRGLDGDSQQIAAGLREQLAQAFQIPHTVEAWRARGSVPRSRMPEIKIGHGTSAHRLGTLLASAVHPVVKR